MKFIILLSLFITVESIGQVTKFPYFQNFDSSNIVIPALPVGWTSTQNRTQGTNDFTTTTSTANSLPNTVVSTNAKIIQNLISPAINLSGKQVDSIIFFERRSSSHDSGILLEASTDGGTNFSVTIGDTLQNPGHTNFLQRSFMLPPELNNQSSVKFRWQVIGNGNGTTGTIRFDDILIATKTSIDAGITNVFNFPQFPVMGDSLVVTATVKNFGLQSIQHFIISFYLDSNFDSAAQQNELFSTIPIDTNLNYSDTVQISSLIPWQGLGELQIISMVEVANDEIATNNQKVTRIIFGVQPFSIVINEIMYRPTAPEPEWIEIMNKSNDSINLKSWKISDKNTESKSAVTLTDYYLKKDQFAVITKDSINFLETHPNVLVRVFVVPTLATFNNDSDAVVLFDQRGKIIDSVNYKSSWGGTDGKSLERIEAAVTPFDSLNWGNSLDTTGATPGKQNYLTPLEYDLKAVRIYSNPTLPGDPASIFIVIKNTGKNPASNFSIKLFHDVNNDTIPQASELITSSMYADYLARKDSVVVNLIWTNPGYGSKQLIAVIEFPQDMRTKDNIMISLIKISFPPQSLIINEIMYDPLSGMSEYVELYNRESFPIAIRDWKIQDTPDSIGNANEFKMSNTNIVINTGEFCILAADSTILRQFNYLEDTTSGFHLYIFNKSSLSLNNDGDNVIMKDLTGTIIDSIKFSPNLHNPEIADVNGRSLERINPNMSGNDSRNWSTSANPAGGTPGKQNSIFAINIPTASSLSFSPNPFSPDGDGFEDHTIISYNLPAATSMIKIKIFDVRGRFIRTLVNNEPSGSSGQVIWDGMNDEKQKARIGIYVVLLEAFDVNGGNVNAMKGVVVLAGKL